MRKGMLIRVAADIGTMGCLGPIFEDGTFEYVPIPEEEANGSDGEPKTYSMMRGRKGRPLSDYIPAKYANWIPHLDPEFETPSYGVPTSKAAVLGRLVKNDVLFFQAGLSAWNTRMFPNRANYIIGYFTVNRIVDFATTKDKRRFAQEWDLLRNNIHVGFRNEEHTFVVVGEKGSSHLLSRAYPFTEMRKDSIGRPTVAIRRDLESRIGLSGFVQRSIPRTLEEAGVSFLLKELERYV